MPSARHPRAHWSKRSVSSPTIQLKSVELRVGSLERSLDFYVRQLGFVVRKQPAGRVELATTAATDTLLTLIEDTAAPRSAAGAAGLFHAALLFPSRGALGRWLRFAAERKVRFEGFSDHGVSEAIYFSDPDGNGLEFYADRPRSEWPFVKGELEMTTEPLDIDGLLAAGLPAETAPLTGAHWGHLHLRVTNLVRSESFYRDTLGLALTQA